MLHVHLVGWISHIENWKELHSKKQRNQTEKLNLSRKQKLQELDLCKFFCHTPSKVQKLTFYLVRGRNTMKWCVREEDSQREENEWIVINSKIYFSSNLRNIRYLVSSSGVPKASRPRPMPSSDVWTKFKFRKPTSFRSSSDVLSGEGFVHIFTF